MRATQDFDFFPEKNPLEGLGLFQDGVLSRPVFSDADVCEFACVRVGIVKNRVIVFPFSRGSDLVTSSTTADGVLELPVGCAGYRAGETVRFRLFRPRKELEKTLFLVGSHDPLLDEIADLIHLSDPELSMRSCHVGSMGGIMAIRREEAHLAGIHLLDEKDGSYNISFVRKYFPRGGVRLVECVGRVQGLMIASGNPLRILDFQALSRPGIRYVNRQKGAGTRILFDFLCRKYGVDTGRLSGYENEKFTHTAVAEEIACGKADVGMGIYSVAKMYHLTFMPVCTEEYDLLISEESWETPMVKKLLSILNSEQFARRTKQLGGYRLHEPGRVILGPS